jgi:hypothetical protein
MTLCLPTGSTNGPDFCETASGGCGLGERVMRTVSSALPALAPKVREVLDQPGAPKPDPAQKISGFTKITDGVNAP